MSNYVRIARLILASTLTIDQTMIPTILLGTAKIPNDGGELTLSQRDGDFAIQLKGVHGELMSSRMYCSEVALAELGCAHIQELENAKVLVGGMGMGFTLAAALKATSLSADVLVAELVPEIIEWNKGPLGEVADRPLDDNRTRVYLGDVGELFISKQETYDAILLDVDNGPEAFTHDDNSELYSMEGLHAIRETLRPNGVLAVWSAWHDPRFTKKLKKARFKVSFKTVRAHKGKGSKHTIYLAQK
ncbi:MAG: spermidine synthase [Arenicella sp.]|jgi:spermidine synthase